MITGVPFAVGLYAWSRHTHERFGRLLFASGLALTAMSLAEASGDLPYTLGRIVGWFVQALFVYLVLAYPHGRLTTRGERLIARSFLAVVLVLFVPRLLFDPGFVVPSSFTSCVADCPRNVFFAVAVPSWVLVGLGYAGAIAVFCLTTAAVVELVGRRARSTTNVRRMLTPVVVAATVFLLLLGLGILVRQIVGNVPAVEVLAWLLAFGFPVLAVGFLLGMLRWGLFAGGSLRALAMCLRTMPDGPTLRRAFAEALDDPDLEIVYPSADGHAWQDADGHPHSVTSDGYPRAMTHVRHDGRVVAAVVHDEALLSDPELLRASTAMAAVALDNQRHAAETEGALRDLRKSRARLAATAERERRRIERDLHDGAQQRLVALRIELGLTADLVARDPDAAVRRLRGIGREIEDALDDVRSLAHGVYPRVLADQGIVAAIREVADRVSVPVEIVASDVGRYPAEVESAVYFCILEALQNTLKHAPDARRAVVRLEGDPQALRFLVRDDGGSAAAGPVTPGAGITNMRDRVAALGGELEVVVTPRVGTVVSGRVPALPIGST